MMEEDKCKWQKADAGGFSKPKSESGLGIVQVNNWSALSCACLPLAWPLGARVASRRRWGAPWSCPSLGRRLCRRQDEAREPSGQARVRAQAVVMPTAPRTRSSAAEEAGSRRLAGAAARRTGPAGAGAGGDAGVDAPSGSGSGSGDGPAPARAPRAARAVQQRPGRPASTRPCRGCGWRWDWG